MVQVRIHFGPLTGLWTIMDVAYYSYAQIYMFRQKIDGHKMSDSLSVLHYIDAGGTVDFLWILRALNIWHFFSVENVPCSTGWTLTHYASFCIAIAAAFPRFWGLVELDLSPRDSPKGLCNISRDPEGGYCGRTSGQRYLTYSGPKWILTCTIIILWIVFLTELSCPSLFFHTGGSFVMI